ncbi:MAG: CehA/McbA family metallohydrolase [Deltaproteobacteria bacterium]|nr:CehA/McbA family metallohydrolase [Deltaproteobacteria bacterium]
MARPEIHRRPGGATTLALLGLLFLGGCRSKLCLTGDRECDLPSPCAGLTFTCDVAEGDEPSVKVYEAGDPLPAGLDTLVSPGDFLLQNDQVVAVIEALDHAHYLGTSGGNLLDLASRGGADTLNHVIQAIGLLPEDAAVYTDARMISGEGLVALQVTGHLDGHPDLRIATRYELRACEPGLRIRTEFANLEPDPKMVALLDGLYWSGRENLPFTPVAGTGFVHPSFGLTTVGDVYTDAPFLAATAHTEEASSYAVLACDQPHLSGFHSDVVSAVGKRPVLLTTRSTASLERFFGVVPGRSVGPAADLALEVREQLFDERWVRIDGQIVTSGGGPLGDEARASVILEEGSLTQERGARTPWTQVAPDAEGRFSARVPWQRGYVLTVEAFGRPVEERALDVDITNLDLGRIAIPGDATLTLQVLRDGVPGEGLVFFHPADEATREAVSGRLHGVWSTCAPLLGAPHGGSPACNRVLVTQTTAVAVPAGNYEVFATAGPFRRLGRASLSVAEGEAQSLSFDLGALPLKPTGTLDGDFHVHGGASFDSSIPHLDRVRAFLAADLDVIVATDHDVVHDYAAARATLDADARLALIVGVETTGHVLYGLDPNTYVPKVIGHWIFWPLDLDPLAPRRGMPWDEEVEPGGLMERMAGAGWPDERGIAQLNHPYAEADFGRDLGWPKALGIDLDLPLPTQDDGSSAALYLRTPEGGRFGNGDYHAQEVMNGTENGDLLPYRAFWFYLLNQGILRAGTANSDSHGLTDNVLGTPRNLIWANTPVVPFSEPVFDTAVREGRMIGTNGPVLEVALDRGSGAPLGPSILPVQPTAGSSLRIRVSAAPWVPVEEVRIIVNGTVVRTFDGAELVTPLDPFGASELLRLEQSLPLSELLPEAGDAWIVVEAGAPLPQAGDLDCDGVPDTTDNDGDGAIDWRDVDRNDDGVVDAADLDVNEDGKRDAKDTPAACEGGEGPLRNPALPEASDAPARIFEAVTPGGYPFAFTNPFVIDREGDGFDAPGLEGGS